MTRALLEPNAWKHQSSPRRSPHEKPSDVIRFEHVTARGGVLVAGHRVVSQGRDEWWLRVLVNGKEVDTQISENAFEDALNLLTSWRPG